MNYKVGQIFYLVGAETARVIPFRVVEEVTRTTLQGVEKSFVAELPDEEKTKVDVDKLKGSIFSSLNELRHHMLENASLAIEKMIRSAEALSSDTFSTQQNDLIDNSPEELAETKEPEESGSSYEVLNSSNTSHEEDPGRSDVQDKLSDDTIDSDDVVKVDIGGGVYAKMKSSDLEKVTQV